MRKIIGLVVDIVIKGKKAQKKVKAKVDSGAFRSSICKSLIDIIGCPAVIKEVTVKSPMKKEKRPLVNLSLKLDNKWANSTFTITKREEMRYKVLLGQNTLKKLDVLIDPKK